MKWNDKLRKAPSKKKEEWTTNERVQEEWEKHVRKRGAKNTQRNHLTYLRVYFRSFDDLVTTLEREDVEAFVERIGTKCAKLMNGAQPQCLAKLPVATCPVLNGVLPLHEVPPLPALGPERHLVVHLQHQPLLRVAPRGRPSRSEPVPARDA